MQNFKYFIAVLLYFGFVSICAAGKPELTIASSPVSCYGKADGEIIIDFVGELAGTFHILVTDSLSRTLAKFENSCIRPFHIKSLRAGNYKIQSNIEGTTEVIIAKITSPDPLQANIITIKELQGEQGPSILGTIEANPSGGNLPYIITWSDNTGKQTGRTAKNLPMGIYTCSIDDLEHCGPVTATFFLFEQEIEKFKIRKNKNN